MISAIIVIIFLAQSGRMGEMPPRIVRVSDGDLEEHSGGWTEILKG